MTKFRANNRTPWSKKKVAAWFGNRGMAIPAAAIRWHKIGTVTETISGEKHTVLAVVLDMPYNSFDFHWDTRPGEIDLFVIDSGCVEIWDSIPAPRGAWSTKAGKAVR
jgi:hypothetical protein